MKLAFPVGWHKKSNPTILNEILASEIYPGGSKYYRCFFFESNTRVVFTHYSAWLTTLLYAADFRCAALGYRRTVRGNTTALWRAVNPLCMIERTPVGRTKNVKTELVCAYLATNRKARGNAYQVSDFQFYLFIYCSFISSSTIAQNLSVILRVPASYNNHTDIQWEIIENNMNRTKNRVMTR